jgi:putative ABC transport system permease protein
VSSARPAVRALARGELRRRWRSLVLLGVATGLVIGAVAGSIALAQRTATSLERLRSSTGAEDARVSIFTDDPTVIDRLAALPGVESWWAPSIGVGRIPDSFNYLAVLSGPPPPPGLLDPVLVDGRPADPSRADEAVVSEAFSRVAGVHPGDVITLDMLTAEEVGQFDTGFGDPDGPRVELIVTGTVRLAPGTLDQVPVMATPAFAERYAEDGIAGRNMYLRLEGGSAGYPAFTAGVEQLATELGVPEGAEEFASVQVVDPLEATESVRGAERVLVTALGIFAAACAAAGLVALGQAFARHHAASSQVQRVEAALGLTAGERTAARVLPSLLTAVVGAVVAVAATLLAGLIEPLGPLGLIEPEPGWRPDVAITIVAALVAVAVVLAFAALTARRAGRRRRDATSTVHSGALRSRGILAAGRPTLVAGLWFALFPGRAGRAVPVRSAVISAVVGLAGLVGALTFAASLDRLEASPLRWGWPGDIVVVDATDDIVADVAADPRAEAVGYMESSSVVVDGRRTQSWAITPVTGELAWTVLDGRMPEADDEITLGPRVADELDVAVGDLIEVSAPDGTDHPLRVVGTALMPRVTPTRLGTDVVLTPAAMATVGDTTSFTEAMISVTPGQEDAVAADLADRYELTLVEPPPEVANLAELGALPVVLGSFLALIGALALVHALVLVVRRRGVDLAVLRAMGFTPRQTGGAVLGTAWVTVVAGAAIGLPLGLALARLTWWVAASDAGVAADVSVPWAQVLLVVPAALALASLVAVLPALHASRVRPGQMLRAE